MDLAALRTRDPTRYTVTTVVRYSDLDPNNHVNHKRYLDFVEECRLALRRTLDAELGLPAELTWPISELSIRYLRSAGYPATIAAELAVVHVGRTSFTLGFGLHDEAGCVATAWTRSVAVDKRTGAAMALPADLAARLRAMLLQPTDAAT